MNNKEPLRLWFPELNSYQMTKLREMIREAKEEAEAEGYKQGYMQALRENPLVKLGDERTPNPNRRSL